MLQPGNALCWLLGEHLGSTTVTANSSGTRTGEIRYKAYGASRYTYGTTPTTYHFTGQREESTIGLYYYGARWYDPALGRFVQADTIVPNPAYPQDLNRYTYGRNNPIKYTDPTGNSAFAIGAIAGLVLGAGYGYGSQVAANLQQGMSLRDALTTDIDATKVAKYASAGLLIGASLGVLTDAAVAAVSIYEATAAAQVGTAVVTAACADGDCTNEVRAAGQAAQGLNVFARASEFGIRTYNQLRELTTGMGLEVHHLIERRFAPGLQVDPGRIPSIVLTHAEHVRFTQAWLDEIGRINMHTAVTTANASWQQIWAAAQRIYAQYPELLEAIRLYLQSEAYNVP